MEDAHSKNWILTDYLNTAPYGTVEGQTAVGAEAAAQTYFGKPAKDLSLTEAALIAGLPQAPSEYNPFLDPKAATERRNEVLDAMEERGLHHRRPNTGEAQASGLGLNPGDKYQVIRDPFLFDLVQQELIDKYGINTVRNGGPQGLHDDRPRAPGTRRRKRSNRCCGLLPGRRPGGRPRLGRPEQRRDRRPRLDRRLRDESQFNYAWQAHRQPGSSFKTFVLTTAIKQGIDPDTTYYDGTSPKTLRHPGRRPTWTVNNAEPGGGVMSLDDADLVHSVNVDLRPARPRRRPRKRHRDRPRNGDRSAARIGAGRGDRRSRGRRHAAGNGRRLRDPRQRRHPPRRRPRSAGSSSPTARSTKPTPTPANGC